MKHFLRKIDASGLFLEDTFWDDGAYPAVPGVPLMTAGSPAIPAVEYQPAVPAVEAAMGVAARPAIAEVLAVAAVPEVLPVQQAIAGVLQWTTAPIAAFAGNPIPADMIATPVPGGFHKPKWSGTAWIEGALPAVVTAALEAGVSAAAKAKLADIDLKSIRSIREYIAAKADAPATLKALETDALAERVKIKL